MNITLREHLDGIADVMALQGASPQQILYYQLYLLCLGLDGFHGYGIREARHDEPFVTLDQEIPDLWDFADEKFSNEGESPLGLYLSDDDLTYTTPPEEFIRTFHELLTGFARDVKNTNFDHLQPSELSDLVSRLCEFKEGMTVYNPFAGVASYATWLNAGDNYFAEEYDRLTWGIGVLAMWIYSSESANYICGDSLNPKWGRKFDRIVSTPPMGLIPDSRKSYTMHLLEAIPTLLKNGGEAILVTTPSEIMGLKGEKLVSTGLLDAVIELPRNVFYWSQFPPVIVKLRCGRGPSDPVTLVDGSKFYHPGGRGTNLIDAGDIYRAYTGKLPGVTVQLTCDEIKANGFRLHPAVYLQGAETNAEGMRMVTLSELGKFLTPKALMEKPAAAIKARSLTPDITKIHDVMEEEVADEEFRQGKYRLLDRPALLIHGTKGKPRLAMVDRTPVAVQNHMFVFEPDRERVDPEYLAYALSKAELTDTGSSVFSITKDDLAMTRIPLPSMMEQKTIIKTALDKEISRLEKDKGRAGILLSRKKLNVGVVGKVEISGQVLEDVSVARKFTDIGEVKAWHQKNKGAVDALVVHHAKGGKGFEVAMLCKEVEPIPVFIVSDEPALLEGSFGSWSDDFLPGRCYEPGQEEELFSAMFTLFDEKDSPLGRIREVYSRQLEAAASLDGKFRYEGIMLADELENILLSQDGGDDWRGTLRKIRDNCILKELSRYGYLPPCDEKAFAWGAMVNLLADRAFLGKEGIYILKKEIFPKSMTDLLRSCSSLLNQGAHVFVKSDRDTQWAALHVIMATLSHLSKMVDSGNFDRLDPERTGGRYWCLEDPMQFEPGEKIVDCLEGNPSYLYAQNVHLDSGICTKEGIRPGDRVYIAAVSPEKRPVVNDLLTIVFYSKDFQKVGAGKAV